VNDLPNLLTDEQRDEYLAAVAAFVAANQRMLEAIRPAAQALLAQFWTLHAALRAAGVIDEHGRFIGGRQADFALCPQPETTDGGDHA
jgi:hypothetical protein